MSLDPVSIMFLIVAIGVVILLILLPRYGPHYTSRLTCPSCKKSFNFHWIPGATITSIFRRNYRDLKCPYCHRKATYDIAATRVRTPRQSKAKAKA